MSSVIAPSIRQHTATPALTATLSVAIGLIVMPLFAPQPLVGAIAGALGMPAGAVGVIAMMPMAGYAAGLLLLVPLVDLLENRRVIVTTLVFGAAALAATAVSSSAPAFLLAAFTGGAATSALQMLVPLVAALAPEPQRGRAIGNAMSGLMVGVVLSRPVASLVGGAAGWRGAYLAEAVVVAAVAVVLRCVLPIRRPDLRSSYRALVASLGRLLKEEPVLRARAAYQGLCMGAFGLFWTAVPLRLAAMPFNLGAGGIALFALAGVAGAVVAPIAGWAGDRGLSGVATRLFHGLVLVGAALAGFSGAGWFGFDPLARPKLALALLAAAAVVLDLGVIGDQTLGRRAVNLLQPAIRGRLNGLYTGLFFLGGAVGAVLAGVAWARGGWTSVCLAAIGFGAAALVLAVVDTR